MAILEWRRVPQVGDTVQMAVGEGMRSPAVRVTGYAVVQKAMGTELRVLVTHAAGPQEEELFAEGIDHDVSPARLYGGSAEWALVPPLGETVKASCSPPPRAPNVGPVDLLGDVVGYVVERRSRPTLLVLVTPLAVGAWPLPVACEAGDLAPAELRLVCTLRILQEGAARDVLQALPLLPLPLFPRTSVHGDGDLAIQLYTHADTSGLACGSAANQFAARARGRWDVVLPGELAPVPVGDGASSGGAA
jgi:hypothetical protein